jgi:hypothetical protein
MLYSLLPLVPYLLLLLLLLSLKFLLQLSKQCSGHLQLELTYKHHHQQQQQQ